MFAATKLADFQRRLGGLPDVLMVSLAGSTGSNTLNPKWGQFIDPQRAYLPSLAGKVDLEILVNINLNGSRVAPTNPDNIARIRTELIGVANGSEDAIHLEIARDVKAKGFGDAIWRLGNESDNPTFGPSAYIGGNGDVYAAAFRHVVDLYRSVSKDFQFCWTTLSHVWATSIPEYVYSGYPGDGHVDYVGMDIYWDKPRPISDADWQVHKARMLTHVGFAKAHGKQFCIPEWASPGVDDAGYLTRHFEFHDSLGVDLTYANFFASGADYGQGVYDPRTKPTQMAALVTRYG